MARNSKSKRKTKAQRRGDLGGDEGGASDSDSSSSSSSANEDVWGRTVQLDLSSKYQGSLKYDKCETRKSNSDREYCIRFHLTVSIVEIPHPTHYSKTSRRRMWNNSDTIDRNAERNIKEFKADGWSWRDATEESDMLWQSTGVLVHPASFNRHQNNGGNSNNDNTKNSSSMPKQRGRTKQRRRGRRAKQ